MAAKKPQERFVLVTTEHRGVFAGYLTGEPKKERITLKRARNCIYWSADVKGFLGLAETGPTKTCRVGNAVQELELFDVTAVALCSETAVRAWEASPWK